MYTYTAGATSLAASFPPWAHDGGYEELVKRLRDPATRARIEREMATPSDEWENLYLMSGPDGILLIGAKTDGLKPLIGKTLAELAADRGKSPEETAVDLVLEDDSPLGTVYFMMSEDNVKKQIALPWVSFGSDAGSMATEGVFLKSSTHPRAYGNFTRLLGKYARDEEVIPLGEAVRRLSSLPAENMKIKNRGRLIPDYFADVVVFDPEEIQDHATFEKPHQYSTGVIHVWVNGIQVLKDGEHTGATPGRVVKGPGWTK
jgi:N-acyl-D-amino-acid deacylase